MDGPVTEAELEALILAFYARVRQDDLIGPLFNAAVGDWPHHLEKLIAFWSSVMRSTGRYKGSPMAAHAQHRAAIKPEMFTRWLALWGDDNGKGGGWKFMDGLHENIAQYTHSGSKPCNMAASGEYLMGIAFEYRANANKAKGAPIDLIFPKEGLGWDLEAFAIHKGTKKLDAAKKLADWASGKDAMLLYGKNFAITAQPGVAAPLANVPKDYENRLVKKDFQWDADNRERILAEWTKRYNAKTEAKK